jgi:phosphohistidine phosphatase SixA
MIVFVLRHADRTPEPADDLSAAGRERAKLLARMLAESGVSVAHRSDAVRARRTLEPLQQKLGNALTVREVGTQEGPDQHVAKVVQAVKSLSAETVAAVVSHSNTVGPIIEGLGAGSIGPIGDTEFDKLFVVFIAPNGAATLLRLRYGAPSN